MVDVPPAVYFYVFDTLPFQEFTAHEFEPSTFKHELRSLTDDMMNMRVEATAWLGVRLPLGRDYKGVRNVGADRSQLGG